LENFVNLLESGLLSCSFKNMLGIECPGCGMQRAFIALLRGDLLLSLQMNPSLLPFLFTVFYTILHLSFGFRNGARNVVWFFGATVFIMVVNFVIKLAF
jgi:hypothetical protein